MKKLEKLRPKFQQRERAREKGNLRVKIFSRFARSIVWRKPILRFELCVVCWRVFSFLFFFQFPHFCSLNFSQFSSIFTSSFLSLLHTRYNGKGMERLNRQCRGRTINRYMWMWHSLHSRRPTMIHTLGVAESQQQQQQNEEDEGQFRDFSISNFSPYSLDLILFLRVVREPSTRVQWVSEIWIQTFLSLFSPTLTIRTISFDNKK